MRILALRANKDAEALHKLMKSEHAKLLLDGPYALADAPAALRRFGEELHSGKVIICP